MKLNVPERIVNKETPRITISIQPGPASAVQKAAWQRFWQKVISEVRASER